ncbi:unnamed protein product [Staurois parvus]|uniref:Uncharacterized protein n=1 Tax=Staurois parvus TaxID=386267 RepID=A0ABN9C3P0_9NEOB|nr:unnamed protein product [Staurois parvus]
MLRKVYVSSDFPAISLESRNLGMKLKLKTLPHPTM